MKKTVRWLGDTITLALNSKGDFSVVSSDSGLQAEYAKRLGGDLMDRSASEIKGERGEILGINEMMQLSRVGTRAHFDCAVDTLLGELVDSVLVEA